MRIGIKLLLFFIVFMFLSNVVYADELISQPTHDDRVECMIFLCTGSRWQSFTPSFSGYVDFFNFYGSNNVPLYATIYNNATLIQLGDTKINSTFNTDTDINFTDFGTILLSAGVVYRVTVNYTNAGILVYHTNDLNPYSGGMFSWTGDTDLRFNISLTTNPPSNNLPTVPQISFPINNSRHYNNSINLTWTTSTDADGDSITYDFWLSSQPDFSNTINRTNYSNNWTGNIATTDGVTYYGKVRSYDGYNHSNWSDAVHTQSAINLINGSWINLTSPFFATSGNIIITSTTGTSPIKYNNISNGTRQRTIKLNISTSSGTDNTSWVYSPEYIFNPLNGTHWNTNIRITSNNITELPFYFLKSSIQNNTAKILIRLTENGTVKLDGTGTNYTLNNSYNCELVAATDGFCEIFPSSSLNVSKWSENTEYATISNNKLIWDGVSGTGTDYIRSIKTFTPDMYLYWNGSITGSGGVTYGEFGFSYNGNSPRIMYYDDGVTKSMYLNGTGVATDFPRDSVSLKEIWWTKSTEMMAWYNNGTEALNSPTSTTIPNVPMPIFIRGSALQNINEIFAYKTYVNESDWGVWSVPATDAFYAYAIPENHIISENKSGVGSVLINLSIVGGNLLQNIQVYGNWSNNATATLYLQPNLTQFTENTAPTFINITLSPLSPSITDNLTTYINATDGDGDTLIKHFIWYKNALLINTLNDSIYMNATGNYTVGDNIYFKGYVTDGYEDSSESQSNLVIIGSQNSAPILAGITLNPTTKKYNKTITVSTSNNITDTESTLVRLQVYRYVSGAKSYFGNSSWVTPPNNASVEITIPWSDGTAHTIYALAKDNGNATQDSTTNLTSMEVSTTFTSDITAPTINSSSVSPSSVTTGNAVTITITADGKGANISSANLTITRPDYTVVTLDLTCTYTSGDNSTCTRSYTANSGIGTYTFDSFGLLDDSNISVTLTSTLTFEATSASTSSSGVGSSTTTIILKETENATTTTPLLSLKNFSLKNITSGATEPQLKEIADCLTQSLFMENKCSTYNYGVVVEPMNWWVFFGAFIASGVVVVGKGVYQDKERDWWQEPLLYGTTTTLIVIILVAVGFNLYILNYITGSSSYRWTFTTMLLWGGIVSLMWDNYYYGKKTYNIMGNT